jgi:hypothetical protein
LTHIQASTTTKPRPETADQTPWPSSGTPQAARPIYHRKRESIEAHLAVVFAALAVGRLVEECTGWSIRRFVRTARRYRTVQIRAGQQLITAADPIPTDLREALAEISQAAAAH